MRSRRSCRRFGICFIAFQGDCQVSDIFTKEQRSKIMSRITGQNSKPELIVRKLLHGMGYRFRLHVRNLPGRPDVVLPKHKKIVLINGCFWHGHLQCKRSKLPSTNIVFWQEKIGKNISRDNINLLALAQLGWTVLVVWGCETNHVQILKEKLKDFMDATKI
jgi:DNA mismatch endonuclease, patch repair protein